MAAPQDSCMSGKDNTADIHSNTKETFKDPLTSALDKDSEDELESLDLDTSSKSEMTVSCSSSLIANFKLDDDFDSETRDLFVMVDNPEKHTSTLESYITFRINTKTTREEFDTHEYCVRRRYNDFVWLRQRLEDGYPTHLVPPLPAKHSLRRLDRFSSEFLRVRQQALQKFLTRIADHPVLSFDKHFHVFLTAKAWEFNAHKKKGQGLISRVTNSLHNISASYMMKNRPPEFAVMHDYVQSFGDKLASVDRITQRILKEQSEYVEELNDWSPVYTLWSNSEDKLTPALLTMSRAIEANCVAIKESIDEIEESFCQPLKEYMLYTEAVKTVLRRRDAIQAEYDWTIDELDKKKDEREQLKVSDQSFSLGAFLGKDPDDVKQQKQIKLEKNIHELTQNVEILNDKSACANADLKADMERWHKTKHRDLREIFVALADKQVERYEKCLHAWEDAIRRIQANADITKPTCDEIQTIGEVRDSMSPQLTPSHVMSVDTDGDTGAEAACVDADADGDHPAVPPLPPKDVYEGSAKGDGGDTSTANNTGNNNNNNRSST
ncbi:sorting nexin-30-like isoform X1 [Octopus sinensis]|uniref:Sorting nexin-30-like isoform X1 n=1 Tax=Octopus sinensis TaxID=2607531 RepID=A0A6P7SRK5_9MOLL|nr:sorting nexin-30-like isoform X1 [Octopus sinensis]